MKASEDPFSNSGRIRRQTDHQQELSDAGNARRGDRMDAIRGGINTSAASGDLYTRLAGTAAYDPNQQDLTNSEGFAAANQSFNNAQGLIGSLSRDNNNAQNYLRNNLSTYRNQANGGSTAAQQQLAAQNAYGNQALASQASANQAGMSPGLIAQSLQTRQAAQGQNNAMMMAQQQASDRMAGQQGAVGANNNLLAASAAGKSAALQGYGDLASQRGQMATTQSSLASGAQGIRQGYLGTQAQNSMTAGTQGSQQRQDSINNTMDTIAGVGKLYSTIATAGVA